MASSALTPEQDQAIVNFTKELRARWNTLQRSHDRSFTDEALAEELGVKASTVYGWTRAKHAGQRKPPSRIGGWNLLSLMRAASVLNADYQWPSRVREELEASLAALAGTLGRDLGQPAQDEPKKAGGQR
jgi:hypothetical protein